MLELCFKSSVPCKVFHILAVTLNYLNNSERLTIHSYCDIGPFVTGWMLSVIYTSL
jgi:hypothetical protein